MEFDIPDFDFPDFARPEVPNYAANLTPFAESNLSMADWMQRIALQENQRQLDNVYLQLQDKDGRIKQRVRGHNLITAVGHQLCASLLGGGSATGYTAVAKYVAIGTSTTAAQTSDTTLGAEITTFGGARVAGTVTFTTTSFTNDTLNVSATWTFTTGVNYTIAEIGLLNASSSGTLYAHQVFASNTITPAVGDVLVMVWQVAC